MRQEFRLNVELTTNLVRNTLDGGTTGDSALVESRPQPLTLLELVSLGEEKDVMLQAFIITLREGVEASLIVGIVFAYLSKIGRPELKRTVFWALGSAVAASVAAAIILAHTPYNSDILEGWVMLGAALFVISMIWFMHRAARSMKGDIEQKIAKYTGPAGVSKIGLFFFVFLLVLREGVETVLILSAVTLNSTELLSFT